MQRKNNGGSCRILAALVVFSLMCAHIAFPQGNRTPSGTVSTKSRQQGDDFLNPASGPLNLVRVLELLRLVQQDIETEGRIMRAIEARNVDFPMTPANSLALSAAGASTKLLELLGRKAPPMRTEQAPSPPEVSPRHEEKTTGAFRLQCEPAECEVAIAGGTFFTKDGAILIPMLPIGQTVVIFRRQGYLEQKRTIVIAADATESLVVKLEPDRETRMTEGGRVLAAMMNAVGRKNNPASPSDLFATGSVSIFDTVGKVTDWNITMTLEALRSAISVKNSGGAMTIECRGDTCAATQPGGKLFSRRLSRDELQNLETCLRQFQKYQFSSLIETFSSQGTTAFASGASLPPTADASLRLEKDGEAYSVQLNEQLLPTLIAFESKTGVSSGVSIAFADFIALDGSRYPRITEIKFPDGKQGLRVHFDQLKRKGVQ
jgi:hypothetical protein